MMRIFNTNLGKGLHYGRKPCPPCDSNKEGKREECRARNLVYKSRQIGETLTIFYIKDTLLNSKKEYVQNYIKSGSQ